MPKISEIPTISALTSDDYLVITNDPGGTPVTRIVTAKNALASTFGNYIDARDYGVTADGTTDDGAALVDAMEAAAGADDILILPSGSIRIGSNATAYLTRGQHLRVTSSGSTTLAVASNLRVEAKAAATTTLASRSERHDIHINVTSASSFVVGDLVVIEDLNASIETGWNYKKRCVRRIAEIDGTSILLDEPLEFFFDPDEASGVTITTYESCYFSMSNVDVYGANGTAAMSVKFLSGGQITDGTCLGRNPGWDVDYTDGLAVVGCSDFEFNRFNFEKLRYGPNVQYARRIAIKNCYAKQLRHMDANSWTQDFLMENIVGISNDGIIQCHPCIRPVFRNVHDSVTQSDLYGLDLRGFGEIVEDCSVTHAHYDESSGGVISGNTNALLLKSEYNAMSSEFVRRITRLRAPYTWVRLGQSPMIVEETHAGAFNESQYTISTSVMQIDDKSMSTVGERLLDANALTAQTIYSSDNNNGALYKTAMKGRRASLKQLSQYRSVSSSADITNATQANPCVITAPSHGFSTGDQVIISLVEGMTQLNSTSTKRTITVIDPNAFSLDGVDATGYGAYTGGGFARYVEPIRDITNITQANPAIVTSAGHGFSNGDVVWVNGVSGMTAANQKYYKVASATTDTFALTDLLDADVDSTGYGAYTSGGKATRQETVPTAMAASSPMAGFNDELLLSYPVVSQSTTGATEYVYPVKYNSFAFGNIDQNGRYLSLCVKVRTNVGYAEESTVVFYKVYSSEKLVVESVDEISVGGVSVNLKHFYYHESTRHIDEGVHPSFNAATDTAGYRYALFFDVVVTTPSTSTTLQRVQLEADEQR